MVQKWASDHTREDSVKDLLTSDGSERSQFGLEDR